MHTQFLPRPYFMKILFAIKSLNHVKGGAEKVLADISKNFADKSHRVSIVSFDRPGGHSVYPISSKVKRISLGIGNIERQASFSEFIKRIIAIRQTAKRIKPDIVIAFMHSTFIPTAFALIGTGVPVIASEHIVPSHYKNRKWEFILLILSRYFVSKITVLSSTIIRKYPSLLRKKMVPIPNPVYKAPLQANVKGENLKKYTLLNVGRLTDQKDQKTLIDAFALLAQKRHDWNLRIIGDGELKTSLYQRIEKHGLTDRVKLVGTTDKIEQEYLNAQIFVLSSKYESFGLATAEAMTFGIPAIGFADCMGTNELIEDGSTGFLVDGNDRVQSLADAMDVLMDSGLLRERMGQHAKEKMKKYYPELIFNKWETLVSKTVKSKKS